MKKRYFYPALLLFLLSSGIHEKAAGADIHVPDDFAAIQEAIDAAVDNDIVIVKPGTYVENIDFLGKAITVKSSDGPEVTVIEGHEYARSVVEFSTHEDRSSILDGFTVTDGCGKYVDSSFRGGGIFCSRCSPTITNNIITRNGYWDNGFWIEFGGGIYIQQTTWSSVICSPLISNNTISDNKSSEGGGIYCVDWAQEDVSAIIKNNRITGNLARKGGGISCHSASDIINNIIAGNIAVECGGGIYLTFSQYEIANCTVSQNYAYWSGGGIYVNNPSYTPPPLIANSIIWNNSAQSSPEIWTSGSISVSHCDVEGGWQGAGNIDADPLFVDPASGDLHLTHGSPCRDAGDSLLPGVDTWDFEGDPRIHESSVDIGADEFHSHLYYTGDSMPGSDVEFKVIGPPGTSAVTLCLGSGIQDPPWPTQYGDLHLLPPILTRLPLGPIPTEGVLVYPATIPDSFVLGEHYPFQALIGPQAPGSHLTNLLDLTPHHPLPPLARRRW